jgi:hypothetical protein
VPETIHEEGQHLWASCVLPVCHVSGMHHMPVAVVQHACILLYVLASSWFDQRVTGKGPGALLFYVACTIDHGVLLTSLVALLTGGQPSSPWALHAIL